jgi:hypothetical protein
VRGFNPVLAPKLTRQFERDASAHAMAVKSKRSADSRSGLDFLPDEIGERADQRAELRGKWLADPASPAWQMDSNKVHLQWKLPLPAAEHFRMAPGIWETKQLEGKLSGG